MDTNILIEIHSENRVLPCVLRSDCFRHPYKLHEISEGVPKSNDVLSDIKRYGTQ
jgi:hypothetical protein